MAAPATEAQPADLRRITEHDPALAQLKSRTVRQLTLSINQLVRDLRTGSLSTGQAQTAFIQRHVALMRGAYLAAYREGQHDYYGAVSREPRLWAARSEPSADLVARRMAFYAPSVAKMAHEAVQAYHQTTFAIQASESRGTNAQGHSDIAVKHTGVMVAFILKAAVARQLALPGGVSPDEMHITLAFLGDKAEMTPAQIARLKREVQSLAEDDAQPLHGRTSTVGTFTPSESSEGKVPVYASVDVPGIHDLQARLVKRLQAAKLPVSTQFTYTPHITLRYNAPEEPVPSAQAVPSIPLHLHHMTVAVGGEYSHYAMGGEQYPAQAQLNEQTITLAGGIGEREDNLASWQSNVGARISLQADLTWSGGQDGYIDAGWADSANPFSALWWDLEPIAQHCQDCPVFAAGSPYDPPWVEGGNILNATPGDGNTECGAACKCSLRYGGSSQPPADWKQTMVPQGTPPEAGVPAGPMVPKAPPPPPSRYARRRPSEGGAPAIPGGDFNAGQKRALDLYRVAELTWNAVRGELPELPNFFTLAQPGEEFDFPRLHWDSLTRAQQKALEMAFESFAIWDANVPQEWRDWYDNEF